MAQMLGFTLFKDPGVYGPSIFICVAQITAVSDGVWDPHSSSGQWRACIHLVGGEHISVCESPTKVLEMLA